MLQEIIDSTPKTSLLVVMLLSPERAFSVRELSGRTKVAQTKASRILHAFESDGLVKSFSKGAHKYYMINPRHVMLGTIKQSLLKGQGRYEDELVAAIRKLGRVQAAFLSGIFTGQPHLPVDILIVGKVNLGKLEKFLISAKRVMGQDINYSVMTVEEFTQRRNTFDRFIKDIFDYRHLTVVDKLVKIDKTKKSGRRKG